MRYFSTFSGIGGFELGIQSAYMQSKAKKLSLDADQRGFDGNLLQGTPSCVGFSEIDKYASSVYEYNFPGAKNYGDITKINAKELPDFDCLVGGFPCQAFSIAGKRQGFADTRGTLFFDLARILAAKKPRLFVFENVKGLLSHDDGNTFKTIIATIDELGYDCQWQVLNSKNHGVPQNRERIYIVGHLRGTPRPEVFPITGTHSETTEPRSGNKVAIPVLTPDRIVKRQNGRRFKTDGEPAFTVNTQDRHGVMVKIVDFNRKDGIGKELEVAHTLSAGDYRGLNRNQTQTAVVHVPEATKKGYAEATVGQAINLSVPKVLVPKGREYINHKRTIKHSESDTVPTIRATHYKSGDNQPKIIEAMKIRRLTPKECERLQGFPDDWTAIGRVIERSDTGRRIRNIETVSMSDTQRYKMCGNAVTTNVVQAVFEKLFANT